MSKISLESPFRHFRGKICKHAQIIFKEMYGTKFTSQICHPRTKPYTEEELARQSKFSKASAAVREILSDAEQRATAESAFKSQRKYKTLWGFLHAQEYAKQV